jgi:alpha-1,3/alpha-1,6-mannosyltransferase
MLPTNAPSEPQVLFLLNFTTYQRSALLQSPSTVALLYTPTNEHFGIVPVEAMACGLPVLACNSGGPTESIISSPPYSAAERTGWLKDPVPEIWAESLIEIVSLAPADRQALGVSAKKRAKDIFSMEAMAKGLEEALKDAEGMGMVDNGSFELLRVVFVVIAGFLLAYLGGPYLIQK